MTDEEKKQRNRDAFKKWREANLEYNRERYKKYNEARREKQRDYARKWYTENKEYAKAHAKDQYYNPTTVSASKEYKLLHSAKYRAKQSNLDFDLELDDILIPEFCPILLQKIELGVVGKGQPNPNGPSLDRIDNSKGYVKGNVRVISFKANMLKRDMSVELIDRLYNYVHGQSET